MSTTRQLSGTWSKLERRKSLIIGCLMSLPKIKKIVWSVIFSYSMQQQQNHFSIRLWQTTKSGFYNNWWQPSQWLDQEETPKHFPKPNLHPKKVKDTVWYSAACLIDNSFLNPGETTTSEKYAQQIDAIHWKLQCLHPAWVNRMTNSSPWQHSTTCHTTNTSKIERIGLRSFTSFTLFTWPLTNQPPLLQASQQLFAGKILPQPTGSRKCFPRVQWILKQGFLHYRNACVFSHSVVSVS